MNRALIATVVSVMLALHAAAERKTTSVRVPQKTPVDVDAVIRIVRPTWSR